MSSSISSRSIRKCTAVFLHCAAVSVVSSATPAQLSLSDKSSTWEASGTLFEACSCAVPCPCNFGQPPTHGYCHTVYAYRLGKAHWGQTDLSGLTFGGGEGAKGAQGFLDARATPAQRTALQSLALAVFAKGGASSGPRPFASLSITTQDDLHGFRLNFGANGGFAAEMLIGADGKNPVVVENNVTWPVARFAKGKTSQFQYRDNLGNRLNFPGANANLGQFRLSGSTTAVVSTKPSCCGSGGCGLQKILTPGRNTGDLTQRRRDAKRRTTSGK